MANLTIIRGGGNAVNLATAQAANAVSTNVAVGRFTDRQQQASILRIIAATGTACDYLLEGSGDGTSFYPLPWENILGSVTAAATTRQSGLFHVAAAGTFYLLVSVDVPWTQFRVTSSGQVGSMVNTYDLWSY